MKREDHAVFVQKLLNTQGGVGRGACKLLIVKWANTLKESSKKFTEAQAASNNNTGWNTDTDEFLEHPPSGGSLPYRGLPSRR